MFMRPMQRLFITTSKVSVPGISINGGVRTISTISLKRLSNLSSSSSTSCFSSPSSSSSSSYPLALLPQSRPYSITTDGQHTPLEVEQLSINEYHQISDDYLELLTDHLLELSEEFPQIDAEYSHGVLNLELPPVGNYCINKQPPNKQIWFSSPISGPDRFDPIGGKWISLRTKKLLGDILRDEISKALELDIKLKGLDD
ncbi:hypothetical protein WICMUC_004950 [Wickerhamomyces mucosus]|uniref:ferroxidase n=1 Tax=Wickerhamomyces mucosus TaxID=1378264 RepID=A0A9P8T7T3_9ASCO|nr:hypothetical protein WICMUC_004950 [Wickerhamomyces mucosus]